MLRQRLLKNSPPRMISRPPLPCAVILRRCCSPVARLRFLAAPTSIQGDLCDRCHVNLARCQRRACRCAGAAASQSGGLSAGASAANGNPCRLRARGCGACTVRMNGEIVRSCLMLAVQTHGASVETIEGLSDSGEIADLQAAFRNRNALQCGFCTPGMLMAAQDLLKQDAEPDRKRIREHLSGNYCRCTGYQAIIDAVETTARARMASTR